MPVDKLILRVSADNPHLTHLMDEIRAYCGDSSSWPHIRTDHIRRELVITVPDEIAGVAWKLIVE